jgi:hypothetical protein
MREGRTAVNHGWFCSEQKGENPRQEHTNGLAGREGSTPPRGRGESVVFHAKGKFS